MPFLRTLVLTPAFEIIREQFTHVTETDYHTGFYHRFNRSQRPLYRFEINVPALRRYEMEYLSAFHAFHQGARSFLIDLHPYNHVEDFQLIGEGNGSKTQFYVPNHYIGANSFQFRSVNQQTLVASTWATTAYSLNATPGVVTTSGTAVASGHDAYALWANQYRCVFEVDGIKISEFNRQIFRAELRIIETPFIG